MGRKTLINQALHILNEKMTLGESRRQAKAEMREELGDEYRFGMATPGIHAIRTRDTYQAAVERFVRWCVDVRGISKYARLEDCRALAVDFLQYRKDTGKSIYTLTTERAALGKLFGSPVDFPIDERTPDKITRSRGEKEMDRHFSEKRNRDLVTIARGTGGRREDLENMRVEHFRTIGGHLFVEIARSKGGRNRISPILPELEQDVLDILSRAQTVGKGKLFESIHSKADIHSYRRQYSQKLYKAVSEDRALRDELMQVYPLRYEPKVKGNVYSTRRTGRKQTYNRDDLYLVSQALGHNRLEVLVTHYLT